MSDAYIHIRIRRSTVIAVVVSLLLHGLMLFWLSRQDLLNQHPPIAEQQSLDVELNPKPAAKPAAAAPPASIIPPRPVVPQHVVPPPKIPTPVLPRPVVPRVISTTKPEPANTPQPKEQSTPAPAKPAPLDPSRFPDMASYVKAVQAARGESGNEESTSASHGPSEDEVRAANIQRNLKQSGTNGVFQISRMDNRSATFSFRGWKNEFSYSHRETYEVSAGPDGDVGRAVVRKMIEIIRRYYSGDFNWDSPRLGRVVVLSARQQDNAGLEDFMIQEFFGARGVSAR